MARHTPLHSLLDLLDGSRCAGGSVSLQRIRSFALSPPHQKQIEQLKALSSLSEAQPPWPHLLHRGSLSAGGEARRRSRQAKQRAEKMRKMYHQEEGGGRGREEVATPTSRAEGEDWEEEIDDLYQWTQKLSFDDIR